jgi:hypothetical protein
MDAVYLGTDPPMVRAPQSAAACLTQYWAYDGNIIREYTKSRESVKTMGTIPGEGLIENIESIPESPVKVV